MSKMFTHDIRLVLECAKQSSCSYSKCVWNLFCYSLWFPFRSSIKIFYYLSLGYYVAQREVSVASLLNFWEGIVSMPREILIPKKSSLSVRHSQKQLLYITFNILEGAPKGYWKDNLFIILYIFYKILMFFKTILYRACYFWHSP